LSAIHLSLWHSVRIRNAPSADRIVCRGRAGERVAPPRASVSDNRQPTEREEAAAEGDPATSQGRVWIRIAWSDHCYAGLTVGADRSGDRNDRTGCLAEVAVWPWHAGPDRHDQATGQAGTRQRSASAESVVDRQSTRLKSGALGYLLALLGQRRGQRSTLFYLALP
jgi:hypothetical protein